MGKIVLTKFLLQLIIIVESTYQSMTCYFRDWLLFMINLGDSALSQ